MRSAAARCARRLGAGWVDWEDVASDVLLRGLERTASERGSARAGDLDLAVRRRCDALAWRERRRRGRLVSFVGREGGGCAATAEGVAASAAGDEREVSRRLALLSQEVREVIVLLLAGCSASACAELLGTTREMVGARARRALLQVQPGYVAPASTLAAPPPPGPGRDLWLVELASAGHAPVELAAVLGIGAAAVRTQLCRARRRLGRGPVTPPSCS